MCMASILQSKTVSPIQNDTDPVVERSELLYDRLSELYPGEVLLEDRVHMTLGTRIRACDELGYPVVVIVGHEVQ